MAHDFIILESISLNFPLPELDELKQMFGSHNIWDT